MKKSLAAILCFLIIVLLTGCQAGSTEKGEVTASSPDYYPTKKWKTALPETLGMDSAVLAEGIKFLKDADIDIHSVIIVKTGYIIADAYFFPFIKGEKHDIASVSKSILSSILGIAMDDGYILSMEDTAGKYLENISDNKKQISINDFMTMRTGFEIASNHMIPFYMMLGYENWLDYINTINVNSDEVGDRFEYNNFAPYINGLIIRNATGTDTQEYADDELFSKLGIKDYHLPEDPQEYALRGYGDMTFMPSDLAKIGLLFLNDGIWEGEQIISKEWVDEATKAQVEVNEDKRPYTAGYGYGWWIDGEAHYSARGRGNQRLDIFPDENVIIVVNSGSGASLAENYSVMNEFYEEYVSESIISEESLPENKQSYKKLLHEIELVSQGEDKSENIKTMADIKKDYLGKTYIFESNTFGIKSIKFEKSGSGKYIARITVKDNIDTADMKIILKTDGTMEYFKGRNDMKGIAYLKSMSEQSVSFYIDELGNIDKWNVSVMFSGDKLLASFIDVLNQGKNMNLRAKEDIN